MVVADTDSMNHTLPKVLQPGFGPVQGLPGSCHADSHLGCHYRWYSTIEICMILDRFDGIVFVGDDSLRHVYTAFNILLRENVALGGLKQWEMSEGERTSCRCEKQFIKNDCRRFAVFDSEEVKKNDGGSGHRSPYLCNSQCRFCPPPPPPPGLCRHPSS